MLKKSKNKVFSVVFQAKNRENEYSDLIIVPAMAT